MPASPAVFVAPASRPLRRLVLCAAVVLAVGVWSAAKTPAATAQEAKAPAVPALPALPPLPPLPGAAADQAKPPPGSGNRATVEITIDAKSDADAAKDLAGADPAARETEPSGRTVVVKKGSKTVTVTGIPGDREYGSFGELVHDEPAIAGMVIAIVAIVFFAPVLAIALIVFYRIRKTRMQNETMLKLAERGIVAAPEGLAAVAGAQAGASSATAIGAAAKDLRASAAWSDLRKGVVMAAIGLALSAHAMLDDRSTNVVGLVFLFLGIGYGALWWFEQRHIGAPAAAASGRRPGDPGNDA